MECQKNKNLANCPCTYPGCHRKGICCECVRHHKNKNQPPACYFNEEKEKTYDRSIDNFLN